MKKLPLIFLWLILASMVLVLLLLNQTKGIPVLASEVEVNNGGQIAPSGIGNALKNFIETKFNIHRKSKQDFAVRP